MSSKDFLGKMREQAKEGGYVGGGDTVAKILIEAGLHRYVVNHDFWSFWKPLGDGDNEMKRVGEELKARLQEVGCNNSPVFGIKITVFKEVFGRDPFKADLQEFIPEWQADTIDMISDALDTLGISIGKSFFGRFQYKSNPFHVKKGDTGKTETDKDGKACFPSIRLPVEKFANEAAARAAVGGSSANSDSKWSDTARATFQDNMKSLEDSIQEIANWYRGVFKGEAMQGYPLPSPLTPVTVKKQIANAYGIETSDIDIAIDTAPF